MSTSRSRLPWVWTGLVAVVSLAVPLGKGFDSLDALDIGMLLLPVMYTGLGSLIVTRQPENRISWVFYWIGFGGVLSVLAYPYILRPPPEDPSVMEVLALIWDQTGFFAALLVPLFLLLFLFPTGRFLTRRWAWAGWVSALVAVGFLAANTFSEELRPADSSAEWTVANPIGFLPNDFVDSVVFLPVGLGLIALLIGGIASTVVRFRRSDTVVRIQIKWVVYSMMVFAITIGFKLLLDEVLRDNEVTDFLFVLSLFLIPISITVAIIRYRLFEIDRLISRTVSYAIVAGVLGTAYLAITALPGIVMGGEDSTGSPASPPPLLVATSTLAVAAMFNPVRRRVLRMVDRRFNRARYEADEVIDEFVGELQETTDTHLLTLQTISVVERTVQPAAIGLWLKEP